MHEIRTGRGWRAPSPRHGATHLGRTVTAHVDSATEHTAPAIERCHRLRKAVQSTGSPPPRSPQGAPRSTDARLAYLPRLGEVRCRGLRHHSSESQLQRSERRRRTPSSITAHTISAEAEHETHVGTAGNHEQPTSVAIFNALLSTAPGEGWRYGARPSILRYLKNRTLHRRIGGRTIGVRRRATVDRRQGRTPGHHGAHPN